MAFSNEFKEAISKLPSKEKDKLLIRLLRKDMKLANRLHFELLSDNTVEEEREITREKLIREIEIVNKIFYSVGALFMDVRGLNGIISDHLSNTKDKIGEIELSILVLNGVLKANRDRILKAHYTEAYKFCVTTIAKAFKILLLIKKLHPDYQMDFQEGLNELGENIGDNHYLMKTAIYNGFDVNWLLSGEIPENIAEIHKEIRANGYLR
jgi:hypothetical protein